MVGTNPLANRDHCFIIIIQRYLFCSKKTDPSTTEGDRMGQDDPAFTPLIWGIKTSLVSYVRALADGEIAVQAPAQAASHEQAALLGGTEGFAFAPDPNGSHFDIATQTGQLRFGGSVTFSGHFNTMRVELSDPRLDLREGSGTLSVRTNGRIGTPRWDAIATATVLPDADHTRGLVIGLALTAAGRLLLGQQYPVGQALDPAAVEQLHSFQ
jgi:Htaa